MGAFVYGSAGRFLGRGAGNPRVLLPFPSLSYRVWKRSPPACDTGTSKRQYEYQALCTIAIMASFSPLNLMLSSATLGLD